MTSSSSNDTKMMVTLVGSTAESSSSTAEDSHAHHNSHRKDRQSLSFHQREDPSSGEKRLYVAMEDTTSNSSSTSRLCEVQVLAPRSENDSPEAFASFLVQSTSATHIVGNGNLYTITEVDPLFFLLPSDLPESSNEEKKSDDHKKHNNKFQWQPLDQILEPLDGTLRKCISVHQMPHIFASMSLGPNEQFYKFSVDKALTWLSKKQAAVQRCLVQQQEAKQARRNKGTKSSTSTTTTSQDGGAFAAGFHMPSDSTEPKTASKSTKINPTDDDAASTHAEQRAKTAREESIQIICSYLNPTWQSRFLAHLKTSPDVLQPAKQRAAKRIQAQVAATTAATDTNTTAAFSSSSTTDWVQKQAEPPAKKPKPSMSFGMAKLKKVNTKGMKKMSAFFTAVPKKKKSN